MSTATKTQNPADENATEGPELDIIVAVRNRTKGGMPVFHHVDPVTGAPYDRADSVTDGWYFNQARWTALGQPQRMEVIIRPVA